MTSPELASIQSFDGTVDVLCWRLERARLVIRGADAKDFLHRMSTQHSAALQPGDARLNVFTTKQGRIVDVVQQMQLDDDTVLLLSALPAGTALRDWLNGFVFVENVSFEDRSTDGDLVLVAGDETARLTAAWLGGHDPCALAPWEMRQHGKKIAVRGFDLVDAHGRQTPAVWLWDYNESERTLTTFLEDQHISFSDAATYEDLRIAAGIPAAPGEICDKFNPLELELHDAIHWNKGCYIGQEVIARIDNYGKQTRWLVGVVFAENPALLPKVGAVLRIQQEDGAWRECGALTSVAPQLSMTQPSALAWLKAREFLPPQDAQVEDQGVLYPVRLVARLAAQEAAG